MTHLDISVVVPVYNGGRYLEDCLESVASAVLRLSAADRDRVEVVVCDNWSTDASYELAEGFSPACRSRVVRPGEHRPNRTQNWHHGLSAAEGTWMMMLHADDLLSPGGLDAQLSAVARAPAGVTIVTGRHRTFSDAGQPSSLHPRWPFPSLLHGPRLARTVLPLHCPFVPFTLMRRSAYEQVGGLDDRWELVQDWELWMRLASAGDVLYHPNEVGMWRLHDVSGRYRLLNAKEHVELSRSLDRSVPRLARSVKRRAEHIQLARSRHHTAAAGQVAQSDLAETAVSPDPEPKRTARVVRRTTLEVAARMYALRLAGIPRILSARVASRQRR